MSEKTPLSFVTLMAVLMSFVALSIDIMLPALSQMGIDLGVEQANDAQLILSMVFLGMAPGMIIFGPISDTFGRKRAIHFGLVIFLAGALISYFSESMNVMLFGRFLQGLGGASCRVVTIAMIRDLFSGVEMAKIMSIIMLFFILVPAFAPLIGQAILFYFKWRFIFLVLAGLTLSGFLWLSLGQEETLKEDKRLPLNFTTVLAGIRETLSHQASRNYTLAAGMAFGAFLGYITTVQQILQVQYDLGDYFSIAFGLFALCIGSASYFNSRLVDRFGMQSICLYALKFIILWAFVFLPIVYFTQGHPHFALYVCYLAPTLFCVGILFGNFNALAMEPLGHIAGVANSVISSLSTFLSFILATFIGQNYTNTVTPLVLGFFSLGLLSYILVKRVRPVEKEKSELFS